MMRYKEPRKAVYLSETGNWDHQKMEWEQVEREAVVIGETANDYVQEFCETTIPYWDDNGRHTKSYTLALGFHKSRFVNWVENQSSLFTT